MMEPVGGAGLESKKPDTATAAYHGLGFVIAYHRVFAMLSAILGLYLAVVHMYWWFLPFGGIGAVSWWTADGLRKRHNGARRIALIAHLLLVIWAVFTALCSIPAVFCLWDLHAHPPHGEGNIGAALAAGFCTFALLVASISIPIGVMSFRCIRRLLRPEIKAWFASQRR